MEAIAEKLEWSALWDAMDAAPDEWIQTTEDMFDQMLGCVPPRAQKRNAFLVGEPLRHNAAGESVHACFKQTGEDYFAKHLTVAQFQGGAV